MALDPQYIISPDLQGYFVDKDTGGPLIGGVVKYFSDTDREEGKDVFILSGNPPDYSYTSIGDEVTLSAVGTYSYQNNDIIPYLKPYNDAGEPENYYIEVYSMEGVLQFTRAGWPGVTGGASGNNLFLENFIPNGQFLAHNDLPPITGQPAGAVEIGATSVEIAQGGWYFERSAGNTSQDFINFERISSGVIVPNGNPRYQIRMSCTIADAAEDYKDLVIKFLDVNKFASDTQRYTFSFTAQTNNLAVLSLNVYLKKDFGVGGPTVDTLIGTVSVTGSNQIKFFNFVFGTNLNDIIGDTDIDNVKIAVRMPINNTYDMTFTDFILTPGSINFPQFPTQTDEDMLVRSFSLPIPNPNGSDLYLPIRSTREGYQFDHSQVGQVIYDVSPDTPEGWLACDGTKYETAGYSTIGIPYSRLQGKLYSDSFPFPLFGTGTDYLTAYLNTAISSQLNIATNAMGATSVVADGLVPTNFTFATAHTGNTGVNFDSYMGGTGNPEGFLAISLTNGDLGTFTNNGTSGFGFGVRNSAVGYSYFAADAVAAASLAGGEYFQYQTPGGTRAYVWFRIDGVGADPAPGGTGYRVDLLSADVAVDVARFCMWTVNGFQSSRVTTGAASTITAGAWFSLYTATQDFYVWYTKDGAGTDPAPSGKLSIQVALITGDTAAQVALKTLKAINRKYFAVPDPRGQFIRVWANGDLTADPAANLRLSKVATTAGDFIGSYQQTENLSHAHSITVQQITVAAGAGSNPPNDNQVGVDKWFTDSDGSFESRPNNTYLNAFIKY